MTDKKIPDKDKATAKVALGVMLGTLASQQKSKQLSSKPRKVVKKGK
jgi:hypothetical protein